jgi:phospholipid/cholesterol/gamma-HCH transport system substrate-binding protein
MFERVTPKALGIGLALILLVAAVISFLPSPGTRTASLHFSRTVAIYPGSELRVMGVKIGQVDAVVPEGNAVRLDVTYDSRYPLPAQAQAAIVTPTLVADRFVQVFPVYVEGEPVLEDGADIPLERTNTPIELDRMYKALDDVSLALGPEPGEQSGPLNNVIAAGAKALEGNGALGGEAIRNLSAAVETFSDNRGPLFENVRSLASLSETLAANDQLVNRFIGNLAGVSSQLAGERAELRKVLAALARVLGTVRGFVKENRGTLARDLGLLGSILGTVEKEKDALALVAQKGPLAMGNLALTFDPVTGTFGSRVNLAPALENPAEFLCDTLKNNAAIDEPGQVCQLLIDVLGPVLGTATGSGTNGRQATRGSSQPLAPVGDIGALIGGGQ